MHHLSSPSNTHGTMAARTPSAPLRSLTEQSGRVACLMALTGMSVLAGCQQQSPARQDSYITPLSTCAYMMPTVSGTRTHGYRGMPGTTPGNNPVESAVAYSNPQTPAFCDRPLPDTLRSALELADYTHLLDSSGLLATLQQTGPFTVFALPNAALEQYNTRMGGQLLNPAHINTVRDILAYTIVAGNWPHKALRAAVDAAPAHSLRLPTLSGQPLTVWLDQTTDQIMVGTPNGVNSQLWVMGIPQSNGVLYFTRALLLPPKAQAAPVPNTSAAGAL
ncbi:fasciclin domain-containing protein [Acetobacter okinawensis]|uniref:fasciclin domain-containing protein n=1 Tax=Acetobacter okinawensis TaxID=1076594 RepID=UPI000A36CB67|nr:fasciclin domain-containing protein [Acetobacter okinawensis]